MSEKCCSVLIVLKVVLLEVPEGKEIYTTYGESVLSATKRTDLGVLAACTHEEADTRLMVHALDATSRGHPRIRIRSNDTDVLCLLFQLIAFFKQMRSGLPMDLERMYTIFLRMP